MNRALRRISIAVLVMFLLLLINVNYLQGFQTASLAAKPGNSRAFYAAQNQYQRGNIVTADGVTIATSVLSGSTDSIKYQRKYPFGPEYSAVTGSSPAKERRNTTRDPSWPTSKLRGSPSENPRVLAYRRGRDSLTPAGPPAG